MLSVARIEANRANAKKSTGPRTPRGKSITRLNAVRHGVSASLPVLMPGESRSLWNKFAAAVARELQPAGPIEAFWVSRIALLQWQLLRSSAARQTLANRQYRQAVMLAPQTP